MLKLQMLLTSCSLGPFRQFFHAHVTGLTERVLRQTGLWLSGAPFSQSFAAAGSGHDAVRLARL